NAETAASAGTAEKTFGVIEAGLPEPRTTKALFFPAASALPAVSAFSPQVVPAFWPCPVKIKLAHERTRIDAVRHGRRRRRPRGPRHGDPPEAAVQREGPGLFRLRRRE